AFSKERKTRPRTDRDRIDRIVQGWTTDPVFLTAGYAPKRLSVGNRNATFNLLVRKYGGDVPPRSVLRELVRTDCVTVKDSFVSLNSRIRRTMAQTRLQYLSQSLVELLKESGQRSNSAHPIRINNGEVM